MVGAAPASFAAVVVAAGRGSRMEGPVPKQYRPLGGTTVLERTLRTLLGHPRCAAVRVVIHPDDAALYRESIARLTDPRLGEPVAGGPTRQQSVRAGLEALSGDKAPEAVLIHDAARPFLAAAVIDAVLEGLAEADGAIPGIAVVDTLKATDADGQITATVPRDALFRAQTPQGFRFDAIRDAHAAVARAGDDSITDDAGIAERAGLVVRIVQGDAENVKITTEEDLLAAEAHLAGADTSTVPRVACTGFGYDVHMLEPGDAIVLGGLTIPHDQRLAGHSDADVALHALTDALFGALAEGDIGTHFPPTDPAWKGASSDQFLAFAAERVRVRVGEIVRLDLTIVCERPKIGPLREQMRARIAEIVGIPVERVSVKATTSEQLGFTGREEGIASAAVATVLLPID